MSDRRRGITIPALDDPPRPIRAEDLDDLSSGVAWEAPPPLRLRSGLGLAVSTRPPPPTATTSNVQAPSSTRSSAQAPPTTTSAVQAPSPTTSNVQASFDMTANAQAPSATTANVPASADTPDVLMRDPSTPTGTVPAANIPSSNEAHTSADSTSAALEPAIDAGLAHAAPTGAASPHTSNTTDSLPASGHEAEDVPALANRSTTSAAPRTEIANTATTRSSNDNTSSGAASTASSHAATTARAATRAAGAAPRDETCITAASRTTSTSTRATTAAPRPNTAAPRAAPNTAPPAPRAPGFEESVEVLRDLEWLHAEDGEDEDGSSDEEDEEANEKVEECVQRVKREKRGMSSREGRGDGKREGGWVERVESEPKRARKDAAAASTSSSGSAGVRAGATASTSSSSDSAGARTGAAASAEVTTGQGRGGRSEAGSKPKKTSGGGVEGRTWTWQAPGNLLIDVMRLVFDPYGNVRDDIVLFMPFDPRLLLWWHPRRRLLKTEQFTYAQLGAMVLAQRMLARLQIMKLGWQLAEGGEVAAKAEAHFRAVCAKWLDDATWQHVMAPVVGALKALAKEEQPSKVLEVAKEGLSPEDEAEVYETFGKAAIDEFYEQDIGVEWPKSPLARAPHFGGMKPGRAAHRAFKEELLAAAAVNEAEDMDLVLRLLYTKWQLAYHIAYFLASHPEAPHGAAFALGLDEPSLAAALAALLKSSTPAELINLHSLLGDGFANLMARVQALRESQAGYYDGNGKWVDEDDEGVEEDEEDKELRQRRFFRRLAISVAGRVKWMTYKPGSEEHKDKQDDLEAYFWELWEKLGPEPACPCCGVRLTTSRRRMREHRRTRHPCNVSPDRIKNDIGYVRGNVRLTCLACNLMRGKTSIDKGKEHVERLADARGCCMEDPKGCLVPTVGSMGYEEEVHGPRLREMAEKLHKDMTTRCDRSKLLESHKTKRCFLTVEDLMEKMRRCWRDGRFIDITGAVFNWHFVSVDRINSDGDYTVENTRLMHVGLNGLKADNHNDFFIIKWLQAIRAAKDARVAAAKAAKPSDADIIAASIRRRNEALAAAAAASAAGPSA